MQTELDRLAHREMGGAGTIKFILSDTKFTSKKTGDSYQKMRCGFFHEAAKCPMVIRCHFFAATKTHAIEVGKLPHSEHLVYRESDNLKKRAGVPKAVKAIAFSSPGKINVRPSVLLKSVRHKEVAVTVKLAKSLVRHQARLRTKELALEPGQAETWGGLHSMCLRYKNSTIVNFNEHSTYLLGLQSCSESQKIIAVISTENLLLNAYRQRFWGQPMASIRLSLSAWDRRQRLLHMPSSQTRNTKCRSLFSRLLKRKLRRLCEQGHYLDLSTVNNYIKYCFSQNLTNSLVLVQFNAIRSRLTFCPDSLTM